MEKIGQNWSCYIRMAINNNMELKLEEFVDLLGELPSRRLLRYVKNFFDKEYLSDIDFVTNFKINLRMYNNKHGTAFRAYTEHDGFELWLWVRNVDRRVIQVGKKEIENEKDENRRIKGDETNASRRCF